MMQRIEVLESTVGLAGRAGTTVGDSNQAAAQAQQVDQVKVVEHGVDAARYSPEADANWFHVDIGEQLNSKSNSNLGDALPVPPNFVQVQSSSASSSRQDPAAAPAPAAGAPAVPTAPAAGAPGAGSTPSAAVSSAPPNDGSDVEAAEEAKKRVLEE